jgi:hypothetical protein
MLQTRGALLSSFGATFGAGETSLGLVSTAGSAGFLPVVFLVGALVMGLGRFVESADVEAAAEVTDD